MNLDRLQVVLVDDDEDDRMFFKDAIEEVDLKTNLSLFGNGQEFLDYILLPGQSLPHLVFLDLNMPIKNGVECLEELREYERFKDLSIAIYSTSSSDEDIEDTFVKGANVYINKPNDFNQLKSVIKRVLKINWQYQTSNLSRENFLLRV
ncbi:response regulator [Aquimarina spongiae]|uniref:Response regulator receiver domain-containing protein n=1 Tax=Aquimarina spongiae TaxID=570521 RepID=A0A1M6GPI1_9FLAO|nr:response regulator [Aquimarina spongiae]SHJ11802.1 Response regulator receiver domain-containing protein [Aquimarina spongiae]